MNDNVNVDLKLVLNKWNTVIYLNSPYYEQEMKVFKESYHNYL